MTKADTTIEGIFYKDPYIVFLSEIAVNYAGADYQLGYGVLNTDTGVLEFQSPSLPDAIGMASQSAAALHFFSNDEPNIDTSMLDGEEEVVH